VTSWYRSEVGARDTTWQKGSGAEVYVTIVGKRGWWILEGRGGWSQ